MNPVTRAGAPVGAGRAEAGTEVSVTVLKQMTCLACPDATAMHALSTPLS